MKKLVRIPIPSHMRNVTINFDTANSKISTRKNGVEFRQWFVRCPLCNEYIFASSKTALENNGNSHIEKHKRHNLLNITPKRYGRLNLRISSERRTIEK